MNGKGLRAIAVSYTAERYGEAFLVPADADVVPIFNKMVVNSVSLYATYGVGQNSHPRYSGNQRGCAFD